MINFNTSSRYKINRKKIKDFAQNYLSNQGFSLDFTINIVFIGKNKMKNLCQNYKKEDVALPVLSFYYNEKQEEQVLLGEVFICYPQAVILAAQRNKKVDEVIIDLIKHGIDNLINH